MANNSLMSHDKDVEKVFREEMNSMVFFFSFLPINIKKAFICTFVSSLAPSKREKGVLILDEIKGLFQTLCLLQAPV